MKLVIAEDGTDLAEELWELTDRAVSSILSYPEGCAALAAAHRARRLDADAHGQARRDFDSLHGELTLIGIDAALARHAGQLSEEHALRGYDAVHLASALALRDTPTLATWDRDLKRAAAQSGCAVAPAE